MKKRAINSLYKSVSCPNCRCNFVHDAMQLVLLRLLRVIVFYVTSSDSFL